MTQKKERVQKFNEIKGAGNSPFSIGIPKNAYSGTFRNEEMQTLYQQYLASGPAGYVRELFSDMGISNPQENADQFYAVMFFSTACMMVQITKKW